MFDFLKKRRAKKKQQKHLDYLKDYYASLDSIPYSEMFRALREEGQMKSLRELQDANQLTSDIRYIWDDMKEEMLLMSLDLKVTRKLYDMNLVYFVSCDMYERWHRRLRRFLSELAKLDTINDFGSINNVGQLYFLNPFDKAVDTSHDDEIDAELKEFFKKAGVPY